MPVDRSFVAANEASRVRLRNLLARLRPEDLSYELDDQWTVAAVLAHLAFWERRALVLLDRWARDEIKPSPVDPDAINLAALPQWRALPPTVAKEHLLPLVEAVDRTLAALPDDHLDAIVAAVGPRMLDRTGHRFSHLDQIEAGLPPTYDLNTPEH